MIISNKLLTAWGSIALIASVFAASFLAEPLVVFVPVATAVVVLLFQRPRLLFYALLISIPWSAEINFTESLGTDLPDEPLMLLMAFTVIAILLFQRKTIAVFRTPPLVLLLLLISLAWTFVTVCLSAEPLLSVKYFLAKGWYLLAFVGAPLALDADEKLIKRSAILLFSSMFVATCVALVRHANFGFAFIKINDALAPFFRNHVNYSALLVFMLPLQAAFYKATKNGWWRFAIALSVAVVLAAVFLSYARGAWLAVIAGLLAYWLVKKGWLVKAFILATLIVIGSVVWLQWNDNYLRFAPEHNSTIFHENFSEHLVATYKGNDVSTAERFYRWVAGARMGKEKWLTGFGPTTFYQEYKPYAIPLFRTWVSENREQSTVHNYFLLLLVEQGIVGLSLFLLLLGLLFSKAQKLYQQTTNPFWKTAAATIASILWMQCTVNFLSDLIETDKVGSVFYLCVAFLIIADAKTKIQSGKVHEIRNDT